MAVYLINYQGTLLSGAEQFQHSIAVDAAGAVGGEMDEAMLDAAEAGIEAFMDATSGYRGHLPSTTAYTNVRVARVLNLSTGALQAAQNRAVSLAGSGSGPLPPQLTVAVSLAGGDKGNGTPYRGRFHVPAPAVNRLDNGRLAATSRTQLGMAVLAMLGELDVNLSNFAPQIWSRKDAVTVNIEQVRIGLAFDTIRSRRRDVPEDRTTIT